MQFGRAKISYDEPVVTKENISFVVRKAMELHEENRSNMDYLYRYYKGEQPILERVKTIRPEINNKIRVNRANEIVSFKVGYLVGEPVQYVSRSDTSRETKDIGELNDMMALVGKESLDSELAEWMYICGVGYRMILPNQEFMNIVAKNAKLRKKTKIEDESPYKLFTLDPRNCFIVRYSGIGEEPVLGVKYVLDQNNHATFNCWTPTMTYILDNNYQLIDSEPNPLGRIPIIEYPLNTPRIGIFEMVMDLLNAENTIESNRVDGVEQFVQSLMILYNADIDDKDVDSIRQAGLVKLKSIGDIKADIKILTEQLNQGETQTLVDYIHQTILDIVGMPSQGNGSQSVNSNNGAAIVSNGWTKAESRAKLDEGYFKKSEREFLKVALEIIRLSVGTKLTLKAIDIKFTRRNYENVQVKSQVLTTMLANQKIHPQLAFEYCGLFSDPQSAYLMSEEYYNEQMEKWKPINLEDEETDIDKDDEVNGRNDISGDGQKKEETPTED